MLVNTPVRKRILRNLDPGTRFYHGRISQRGRHYRLTGWQRHGSSTYAICEICDAAEQVVGSGSILAEERVEVRH